MIIKAEIKYEEDFEILDPETEQYVKASECADYKKTIVLDIAEALDVDPSQVTVEINWEEEGK